MYFVRVGRMRLAHWQSQTKEDVNKYINPYYILRCTSQSVLRVCSLLRLYKKNQKSACIFFDLRCKDKHKTNFLLDINVQKNILQSRSSKIELLRNKKKAVTRLGFRLYTLHSTPAALLLLLIPRLGYLLEQGSELCYSFLNKRPIYILKILGKEWRTNT